MVFVIGVWMYIVVGRRRMVFVIGMGRWIVVRRRGQIILVIFVVWCLVMRRIGIVVSRISMVRIWIVGVWVFFALGIRSPGL